MDRDAIVRRWRANANAAGVHLTDEDVERIVGRGVLDRVLAVENILTRAEARETVPDYLAVIIAAGTGDSTGE